MSPDGLELTRQKWAREQAADLWDAAYLERERKTRRAWIAEELIERKKKEDEEFFGNTEAP